MRRFLAVLLTVILVCVMSFSAFAAKEEKENNVTVKYVTTVEGEYRSDVDNGKATADGVTVTDAPADAKTLVVIPMKGEAFEWIDSLVDGDAKAAYDIHFEDAEGNRMDADGVSVRVAVSGSELSVSSVNTSGADKSLSFTTSGDSVSFTTDGNPYYVIYKKGSGETVTVPVRGDDNEIHADVTLDGDTVELHELDFAEIDHIIGDKDQDGLIEIDLTELDEKIKKIELPMASIKHIVEAAEETHNEHEHLQIDFPHGSVTLDDKTLRAIIDTVGEETTATLLLESVGTDRLNDTQDAALDGQKIYGGYEAYLVCNNTGVRVSDFKGGVATLSVPFEIPNGLKAEKFAVWYVADDGKTQKTETWHDDGKLHWNVGYFSDFVIVYEGNETPITPDDPSTGDNSNLFVWIALFFLGIGAVIALLAADRKRRAAAKR